MQRWKRWGDHITQKIGDSFSFCSTARRCVAVYRLFTFLRIINYIEQMSRGKTVFWEVEEETSRVQKSTYERLSYHYFFIIPLSTRHIFSSRFAHAIIQRAVVENIILLSKD